jgi:hypothetical protein
MTLRRTRIPFPALAGLGALAASNAVAMPIEDRLAQQRAAFDAEVAKTVIELQPYRSTQEGVLPDGTPVELISLNPNINSWFLLGLGEAGQRQYFHLENPSPDSRALTLDTAVTGAALLISEGTETAECTPWEGAPSMLTQAAQAELPYAPLCDNKLFLRIETSGSRTSLEATSEFLRDHVWGGDAIVTWVKATLNKDKFALLDDAGAAQGELNIAAQGPLPARVRYADDARPLVAAYHTFDLVGAEQGMATGAWYPVKDQPGVFVSGIQPRSISDDVLRGPGRTNWLDNVEGRAIDYLVAFEIDRFDLSYSRGTDHPRLNWSPRPPAYLRPRGLPGPDGISTDRPVVSLGMVSPYLSDKVVAAFTAGFKRQHAAFRGGPLRDQNYGTHYGFLEHGVVLSKLWPGLSTLYVMQDGTVGMKTWSEEDEELLPNLRFARQNGTPLIEEGLPGPYVTQWLPGNWSGSANADLRTLRAGACLMTSGKTRYLVYGYFSTATPSAMSRTFQAYGCEHAMLLDMNALEHTYLGLYAWKDGKIDVSHVMRGMEKLDKRGSNGVIPRFIGFPDNRDLFYLTRKE